MPSPFEDNTAARELLEKLRWPDGPVCPHCRANDADVSLIGGERHREGLYHCKKCRKSFTVTVGTAFERLRIPLSTWMRAARAFRYRAKVSDGAPTLLDIQSELKVAYRTVLRMRDVIKRAAVKYRGHKHVFGRLPEALMLHKRMRPEETIKATGVLKEALPAHKYTEAEVKRTERLLRLLLAAPKMRTRSCR